MQFLPPHNLAEIGFNTCSCLQVIKEVLERLTSLCVAGSTYSKKPKKHEQRLLRNMGAHAVVLELLQIPFEKVSVIFFVNPYYRTTRQSYLYYLIDESTLTENTIGIFNSLFGPSGIFIMPSTFYYHVPK